MLPNLVAKLMSPEEIEIPVGKTGELWIKGPNISRAISIMQKLRGEC